ncbi:MAG TPA: Mov34/MPN/PAD-1 family protein [Kofleriaceae bacterium]|jgi:hypothetical protein|nr:Mov34/MPN/PAD-1 family protein [Kofleriaceae bacterium]
MMAREVCFVIGRGGAILWADASDRADALPDSRARWEAIWAHRDQLEAIAHSHPSGPAAFSAEDESTMQAIDSALGRPVRYCVVAPGRTIARTGERPGACIEVVAPEPWWAGLLRLASGMAVTDTEE